MSKYKALDYIASKEKHWLLWSQVGIYGHTFSNYGIPLESITILYVFLFLKKQDRFSQ